MRRHLRPIFAPRRNPPNHRPQLPPQRPRHRRKHHRRSQRTVPHQTRDLGIMSRRTILPGLQPGSFSEAWDSPLVHGVELTGPTRTSDPSADQWSSHLAIPWPGCSPAVPCLRFTRPRHSSSQPTPAQAPNKTLNLRPQKT